LVAACLNSHKVVGKFIFAPNVPLAGRLPPPWGAGSRGARIVADVARKIV
jgi:hypothetical protein